MNKSSGLSMNIPLMYAITFFQGMAFYAPVASLYHQARGLTLGQIALIESISVLLSTAVAGLSGLPEVLFARSHFLTECSC